MNEGGCDKQRWGRRRRMKMRRLEKNQTFHYRGGNAHQSWREKQSRRQRGIERERSGWGCHLSSRHCCHPWRLWKAASTCSIWCQTSTQNHLWLLIAGACAQEGEVLEWWIDEGGGVNCYISNQPSIRFTTPNSFRIKCNDRHRQWRALERKRTHWLVESSTSCPMGCVI